MTIALSQVVWEVYLVLFMEHSGVQICIGISCKHTSVALSTEVDQKCIEYIECMHTGSQPVHFCVKTRPKNILIYHYRCPQTLENRLFQV